jgi:hypothetical protein
MASYYTDDSQIDWLTEPWGGPYYEEDEDDTLVFLPIYGPVNCDGAPLGCVLESRHG